MQHHQPVAQSHHGHVLDEVVLHRYNRRHTTRRNRLACAPGDSMRRAASNAVDVLALQGDHLARPLDGSGGAIAQLALVVVPPREHLTLVSAGNAVQGAYNDKVNHQNFLAFFL